MGLYNLFSVSVGVVGFCIFLYRASFVICNSLGLSGGVFFVLLLLEIASCRDVDSDRTPDSINGLSTFVASFIFWVFLFVAFNNEVLHAKRVEEGDFFLLRMCSFRSPISIIWFPSHFHWKIWSWRSTMKPLLGKKSPTYL